MVLVINMMLETNKGLFQPSFKIFRQPLTVLKVKAKVKIKQKLRVQKLKRIFLLKMKSCHDYILFYVYQVFLPLIA